MSRFALPACTGLATLFVPTARAADLPGPRAAPGERCSPGCPGAKPNVVVIFVDDRD